MNSLETLRDAVFFYSFGKIIGQNGQEKANQD